MRPLFRKIAPGFLASYLTRNTGARTRTGGITGGGGGVSGSKAYAADEYSPSSLSPAHSQTQTQHDIIETMNREMDRQLMNFELAEQGRGQGQGHAREQERETYPPSASGESDEVGLVFAENNQGRGDKSSV